MYEIHSHLQKTLRYIPFQVVNDSNIQYLNPDDDDEPGVQLYVTQVFIHFLNWFFSSHPNIVIEIQIHALEPN